MSDDKAMWFPKEWTRDRFPAWLLFADEKTKRAFECHIARQEYLAAKYGPKPRKKKKQARKVVDISEARQRRKEKNTP